MNKQGFTLLETIVAISVGSLLITLALSMYILANRENRDAYRASQLAQNGRIALERILHDVRNTTDIATPLPTSDTGSVTSIEVADPYSTTLRYVRYYVLGTDLYRQIRTYAFATYPDVLVPPDAEDQFATQPVATIISNTIIAQHIETMSWYQTSAIATALVFTQGEHTYRLNGAAHPHNAL